MSFTKTISGWGKYLKTKSEIVTPKNFEEIINNLHQPSIPRGMGRSYGDSANFQKVIQTNLLNKIIEFDEESGSLTCEAGITIRNILDLIIPKGWFMPVSPGTSYATLGGAIASDVHGKNHHLSGTFGEHVRSIKIMLGNGEIVSASSTNLPDLFRATCGGMGLTGVILSATINLLPVSYTHLRAHET